jgi:amidohydrolase
MERLVQLVAQARDAILETEAYLWKHPAPGYREWEASQYLGERLEQMGCKLTYAQDIPGFVTQIETGRPGPCVLVLAELDSLIVPGHPDALENGAVHACGHHAQGAALVGLAAALTQPGALDGLSGSIRLCAVPAEELIETSWRETLRQKGTIRYFGGKIEFMHRGLFDGVDLAFMVHASNLGSLAFMIEKGSNGCVVKNICYEGVSAHAGGAPHEGVNALYAANVGLQAINALRETFRDEKHVRVHPIITKGGDAVNAIPAQVCMESYVRACDVETILQVNTRVNRALAASAAALGANVVLSDRAGYTPLVNDVNLMAVAHTAMLDVCDAKECAIADTWNTGCTDMGDVSAVMPAIHAYVGGAAGTGHGADFRIEDRELACVKSAQFQAALLCRLLGNDAQEAIRIVRQSKPRFASIAQFLETLEDMQRDVRAVSYLQENRIELAW